MLETEGERFPGDAWPETFLSEDVREAFDFSLEGAVAGPFFRGNPFKDDSLETEGDLPSALTAGGAGILERSMEAMDWDGETALGNFGDAVAERSFGSGESTSSD